MATPKESIPPDKPAENSPTSRFIAGTTLPTPCLHCNVVIKTKKESMMCGFCHKWMHVKCVPGTFTPDTLEKLQKNETFYVACHACRLNLPKIDPINSLISESTPMRTLAQKQDKLDKATGKIVDLEKAIKEAERRALIAERMREEEHKIKIPAETREQMERVKAFEKEAETKKIALEEEIQELKRKFNSTDKMRKDLEQECLRLNDEVERTKNELSQKAALHNMSDGKNTVNDSSAANSIKALKTQFTVKERALNEENEILRKKAEELTRQLQTTASTSTTASQLLAKEKEIQYLYESNSRFEEDLRKRFETQLEGELERQRQEAKIELNQRLEQEKTILVAQQKRIIEQQVAEAAKTVFEQTKASEKSKVHPAKRIRFESVDSESSTMSFSETTENLTMEMLQKQIMTQFEKLSTFVRESDQKTNDRIDVLAHEIREIRRGRAVSPGNNSLNESALSPRAAPQNVNINVAPPPQRTSNQSQIRKPVHAALSYAQALSASKFPTNTIRNVRIMGDDGEANDTATKLKKDSSFTQSNIREIIYKSPYNITIKCKSEDDAEKLEAALALKYGQSIMISVPREFVPEIKITNVISDIAEHNDLEDAIRKQNYWAEELNFKITDTYTVPAQYGPYRNLIIQTNLIDQKKFLERKKVVLGLSSCRIHEHANIISCQKCQRYGHFKRNCSYQIICRRCGEDHELKDCTVPERNAKCANCVRANKNGGNFSTKHRTTDERCGVRKQRIDALKHVFLTKNP